MHRSLFLLPALIVAGCAAESPETDTTVVVNSDTVVAMSDAPAGAASAVADLAPTDSTSDAPAGRVEFIEVDGGVEVRYNLTGLSGAGPFGFHVHENGDCGPDSTGTPGGAAGGHFNPMASPHGAPGREATVRHAGDLGNVTPGADGAAVGTLTDSVLAFSGPTSLVGRAVVLHAQADDLRTQPTGDAGGRVACGIIEAR